MLNYPLDAEGGGDHPVLLSTFELEIVPATCDCTLLTWIYPTSQTLTTSVLKATSDYIDIVHATIDPSSYDTTPAIRACYRTDLGTPPGCDETTVITDVVVESTNILPGYMTMDGDRLTVAPTSNSQVDTYVMLVTHNMAYDSALINFNTVTVIVNVCLITHIDPPSQLTDLGSGTVYSPIDLTVNIDYSIHALNDITLDLSNPGFVQQPACGYTLQEVMAWSFNPNPAPPIITDTSLPY